MAQAQTATKAEPVRMGQAVDPALKTRALQWQTNAGNTGHLWREAFISLPESIKTPQALNDAPGSFWSNLQATATTALQKRDRIYFESHDGKWAAEARVSYADRNRVVLAGLRHYSVPVIESSLFSDELYAVVPYLGSYIVERRLDGVNMGSASYASPEQARQALLNLYSTRAA